MAKTYPTNKQAQPMSYNSPRDGIPSSIGYQAIDTTYIARTLRLEIPKRTKFGLFSSKKLINLPMYSGKNISVKMTVPLLSAANINNQGVDRRGVRIINGNLYGESQSVDYISAMLPLVPELGGDMNQVGFSRQTFSTGIYSLGFHYKYTNDSIRFDSEGRTLLDFYHNESIKAVLDLEEKCIQLEVLANATTRIFPGIARRIEELGEENSTVQLKHFKMLEDVLNRMNVPKTASLLSGSAFTNTTPVPEGRYILCPQGIRWHLENLVDSFGQKVFIPIEMYRSQLGQPPMDGEIGTIRGFRFIEVPNMIFYQGRGREVEFDSNFKYSTSADGKSRLDVFPLVCIGEDAFTSISIRAGGYLTPNNNLGTNTNLKVIQKVPGDATAGLSDVYGRLGFTSYQWDHGTIFLHPERIGIIYTTVPNYY